MIDKKLKEALELIGGKAILKDQDQYYVLMSFKELKKLRQGGISGLTKQELVDKINNDIASWKVSQEEEKINEIDLEEIGEKKDTEIRYEKA
ncbi:MAG TPA: hypothetical protein PLK35_01550 [Candidatus Moranbacteria bacterium]|nr:hypothetical protein [Candidatus Moranbacteria bacterium]